jgi:hypothetical protein
MEEGFATEKLSVNTFVRNMSLLDKINFLKSSRMLEDEYAKEERICERARMSMLLSNADRKTIKNLSIDKKLTFTDAKFLMVPKYEVTDETKIDE